ncbi:hypothetical protein [Hyphomicrobium sp. MC1]|uniref:hypothetical protein n=1 Tax=Hyphomicrobium sp. (strain MC1) TaxID=717785 RepID=UPI000213DCDA|nr:hypothetical protein [Hyphomicrobium sp. MC1]CCB64483.1 conserved exported protein of unknown function [Hyphomicrobium sp. MC1]
MIGLITFAGTLWGRVAVAGGIFAALVTAWLAFAAHYKAIGESRVLAKIEQRTNENVDKAQRARASVENLPADQLRDRYRRD